MSEAAAGPVIPNFGQGDSCVTGDHAFCWGWVHEHWGDTLGPALVAARRADRDRGRDRLRDRVPARTARAPLPPARAAVRRRLGARSTPSRASRSSSSSSRSPGITWTTVEIALVGYTLVILFPNIVAGLRSAPDDVIEAARGMGLTRLQVLMRVELPLALPAIVGGLRIAVVSTVAIATIAAFLLPKGLGYPIFLALKSRRRSRRRSTRPARSRSRSRSVRPAARRAAPRARAVDEGGAMIVADTANLHTFVDAFRFIGDNPGLPAHEDARADRALRRGARDRTRSPRCRSASCSGTSTAARGRDRRVDRRPRRCRASS